jgi:DNA-binding helix-hairpin-helix protein with protein kinase domain
MAIHIRRREFISTLCAASVAWPLVARAQQPGERRIGVLMALAENDPEARTRVAAFLMAARRAQSVPEAFPKLVR